MTLRGVRTRGREHRRTTASASGRRRSPQSRAGGPVLQDRGDFPPDQGARTGLVGTPAVPTPRRCLSAFDKVCVHAVARCATRSGSPIPRHIEPPGPTAVSHVKPRRRPIADRPPLDRKPLTDNSPVPVDLVPISPCPGLAPNAGRRRGTPRRPPADLPGLSRADRPPICPASCSLHVPHPIWPPPSGPDLAARSDPRHRLRGAAAHTATVHSDPLQSRPRRADPRQAPPRPVDRAERRSMPRHPTPSASAPTSVRTDFHPHPVGSAAGWSPSRRPRRPRGLRSAARTRVPAATVASGRFAPRPRRPRPPRAVPDHLAPFPSPLRIPDHSHVLAAVPATTKRTAKPTSSRRCASDQGRTGALRVIHTGYPQAPTVSRETPRGTGCRPVDDAVCSRPSGAVDIDVST